MTSICVCVDKYAHKLTHSCFLAMHLLSDFPTQILNLSFLTKWSKVLILMLTISSRMINGQKSQSNKIRESPASTRIIKDVVIQVANLSTYQIHSLTAIMRYIIKLNYRENQTI